MFGYFLCRVYCAPCVEKLCGGAELDRVSIPLCHLHTNPFDVVVGVAINALKWFAHYTYDFQIADYRQ